MRIKSSEWIAKTCPPAGRDHTGVGSSERGTSTFLEPFQGQGCPIGEKITEPTRATPDAGFLDLGHRPIVSQSTTVKRREDAHRT